MLPRGNRGGGFGMRGFGYLSFTLLFLGCSIAGSDAAERLVMPSKGDTCRSTRMDADRAAEESEWRCAGPAGYSLIYSDHVTRGGVSIGFRGAALGSDSLTWPPAQSGIGSRIEWRIKDGSPVAAIVGRWRRVEGRNGSDDIDVEELMVIKITPTSVCATAIFGALSPTALMFARETADRAAMFRCEKDKPIINTDLKSDAIKALDGRFSAVEILDHNGSIVELRRSRIGIIEIRYREPRAALKLEPGTVLFRGAEHNGRISGEAFVFKAGCQPASYGVTGARENGLLFLEGAAPRRGNGCSIVAQSKSSPHARLAFAHEPVIPDPTAIALKELSVVVPCGKCMAATVQKLEGVGSDNATLEAEVLDVNIRDHCENWNVEADKIAGCIIGYASQKGSVQRATANCQTRTISPSSGGKYQFQRLEGDDNRRSPLWTDLSTGKMECLAYSCNTDTASAQFAKLCPGSIPGWNGRLY